jgi:hypothetical protein
VAICDRHGCGKEELSREKLEVIIEEHLHARWTDRGAAIVIDPELENWFWSESPHVAQAINWPGGMPALRAWLLTEGLLKEGHAKPADPKGALEAARRRTRIPKSRAIFRTLAAKVSLEKCGDPAFLKFKAVLRAWFPARSATTQS